jgi:type I restriction enzyme S subunit
MKGATEMRVCRVEEIAPPIHHAIVGGPFGSDLVSKDYVPEGIPVIRGQNMSHGRWVAGDFVFVTSEKADSLIANTARPGDIVFTQRGTLGQVSLVPYDKYERYVISQSQMKVTPDPAKADSLFLYYLFTNKEVIDYIFQHAIQTGVPHINLSILKNVPILLPPLPEQRAIAEILGALDDKIELNRRMNATLESMARALFKSWFVDFDPVRAKMAGCAPAGMDAATAALFPAALQESELGPIPAGWRVATVGEVVERSNKTVKSEVIPQDAAYIGLEHMPRRSIALDDWGEPSDLTSHKTEFAKGDILFGKLRPYFHKVGVAPVDGICSTDIIVMKPKDRRWFGMLLEYVSSDDLVGHVDRASTGTKMPRASWSDIATYKVPLPSIELAGRFTDAISPLIEQMICLTHQSKSLSRTRDALLPKLLSGELDVAGVG